MQPKHSGIAISSFIISAVSAVVFFGALATAMGMSRGGQADAAGGVFGLGVAVGVLGLLASFVLGLIGLFAKEKKRLFAVLALLLALVTALGLVYVIRGCWENGAAGFLAPESKASP
ncbi:hypothetical protein FJY68_13995 [candidate division WOR-3 bacterium]|uniref:Uncharacterized protein n=1 Tax=candidate division WOR-3 bacterium TaxID=2052148 RepID=A0A937XKD6_UNCW3|nr:hypothetical protein [candidate division WOR-3 bacterium]